MCGYANPLSFKEIDDSHIAYVENFIKENAFDVAINSLKKNLSGGCEDGECDILLDDDQMIEIYGRTFAKSPENFQFMLGDKLLIQTLVAHVKRLVDTEGLVLFDQPKKEKEAIEQSIFDAIAKHDHKYNNNSKTCGDKSEENHIALLEFGLYEKIGNCLVSYDIDLTNWNREFVTVDESGTYGSVHCILCQHSGEKKQKPHRVYYSHSGKRSSYWVLSNFTKHLEKKHSLSANRSHEIKSKEKNYELLTESKVEFASTVESEDFPNELVK